MTTASHLARKNRKHRNQKKWAPPFPINFEQNKRRLLRVEFLGGSAAGTTYRVLNLVCGHESVITHRRFQEKRNQNGLCQSCARQEAVERQKEQWYAKREAGTSGAIKTQGATWLELWRDKQAQQLRECLWAHDIWNRSINPTP